MSNHVYFNRELSWLLFNERVLDEAACLQTPPLERLRFLHIFQKNLDEFFMIRVGSLFDRLCVKDDKDNKTGMTIKEQIQAVYSHVAVLMQKRDIVFGQVMQSLAENGIIMKDPTHLEDAQAKQALKAFERDLLPMQSPQVISEAHSFPHLHNKQIYIAVQLESKSGTRFGLVGLGNEAARIVTLPCQDSFCFALAEEILLQNVKRLFAGRKVVAACCFCVTRNADISADEGLYDQDVDYRSYMKELLKKRGRLHAVRMETLGKMPSEMRDYLCDKLELHPYQVFESAVPFSFGFVPDLENAMPVALRTGLLHERFVPSLPAEISMRRNLFHQIKAKDILLSYPYQSMRPFLQFLQQAADDDQVTSIKITLYRVGTQSKMIEALCNAAENGKYVWVFLELRARFDEERNIDWAAKLEAAGCKVMYARDSNKVHCKICLITRRENHKTQYYGQVGTGNYNEETAKVYTDFCLMTTHEGLCKELAAIFEQLETGIAAQKHAYLLQAPTDMKSSFIELIEGQITRAKIGKPARIMAKCNALTDKDIIDKLVEASGAGVEVKMIVRGICCLRPQIPGLTDHISIVSIVGRFLEHARIYAFGVGEETQVYISSADWMTRNQERRVEIACPILDKELRHRILYMMNVMFSDNVKARDILPDGGYAPRMPQSFAIDSQLHFLMDAQHQQDSTSIWRRLFKRKI